MSFQALKDLVSSTTDKLAQWVQQLPGGQQRTTPAESWRVTKKMQRVERIVYETFDKEIDALLTTPELPCAHTVAFQEERAAAINLLENFMIQELILWKTASQDQVMQFTLEHVPYRHKELKQKGRQRPGTAHQTIAELEQAIVRISQSAPDGSTAYDRMFIAMITDVLLPHACHEEHELWPIVSLFRTAQWQQRLLSELPDRLVMIAQTLILTVPEWSGLTHKEIEDIRPVADFVSTVLHNYLQHLLQTKLMHHLHHEEGPFFVPFSQS